MNMIDPIQLFDQDSDEFRILYIASLMLIGLDKPNQYSLRNMWFDYGAGRAWTTIAKLRRDGVWVQFLTPMEQKELLEGGYEGICKCAKKVLANC
jgi:hypothetical protein